MREVVLLLTLAWGGEARADCVTEGDVVLNELAPAVAGDDADAEWVELLNRGNEEVDLSGWIIEAGTRPESLAAVFTLPEGTLVPAGGHLVVAGTLAELFVRDVLRLTMTGSMGNASSNADAVRLVDCAGGVRDVIAYGTNNGDGVFVDEEGEDIVEAKLSPKPADGRSIARLPDGADTNNGAVDTVLANPPTPGESNGGGGVGGLCVPGDDGVVVINELLANPGAGTNPGGSADSGYEWVELFVPGDAPVDVSGWRVEQAGSPADWGRRVKFTFPPDTVLQPGAHAVVADPDIALDDVDPLFRVVDVATLSLGNSQDGVRLVDCAGGAIDTVVYGGSNPDGFEGPDGAWADDEVGPAVVEDASLARRADGQRGGTLAQDFVTATTPTPGRPNEDLTCRSAGGTVFINEIMPNAEGTDSTARSEWVELVNGGRVDVTLTGWTLSKASSRSAGELNETLLYTFGAGVTLQPGEFLVVGAVAAVDATLFTDPFDLPSGDGGDLVLLADCTGARADSVLYGGDNDDLLDEDDGYIPDEAAPKPSEEQCVARLGDGVDSNSSVDDFVATTFCTPGAANNTAGGGGGGGTGGPNRGCNGPPDGGGGPRRGCQTAPAGASAWLALWWILRAPRRRRAAQVARREVS